MGSIYGVVFKEGKLADQNLADKISRISSWWKPDSSFDYTKDNVILGQENLHAHPTVLLEASSVFNHPSNYKIISDARIDNREVLLEELQLDQNTSNSQLILELFIKYGYATPSKLIGAFSFAIWHPNKKQLFCARDHLGVKPMNYYWDKGLFLFATQLKCILAFEEVDKTPDWRNMLNKISGMGVPPNSTAYLSIKKLPPAHFLLLKDGQLQIKSYWSLDVTQRTSFKNDDEYISRFKELFDQAVEDRMDTIGMLGSHLSGGLDSTGVSGVVHELSKKRNVDCLYFSYNVEEKYLDGQRIFEENALAYDFVKMHKLEKQFINVHQHVHRSFQEMVEHESQSCDALSRSNNVNTEYEMQYAAKEHNTKVILSGFLGDELITSFCRPYYLEYFSQGKWIKYFLKKMKSRHGVNQKMKGFGGAILSSVNEQWATKIGAYYNERRVANSKYALNSKFLNQAYFNSENGFAEMLKVKYYPMAHRGFPTSLRTYQRNHITRAHTSRRMESENLSGLRHGVEYRYPMADIRVVQYVLSLPMEQKISEEMSRRVFRLALKDRIPDSIRLRDVKNAGSLKPMLHLYERNFGNSPWELLKLFEDVGCAPFLNPSAIKKHLNNKERSPLGVYNWMVLAQLGYENKMKY